MSGLRSRQSGISACILLVLALAGPATAQEPVSDPGGLAVLVIDQERLFAESAFGKAAADRERIAFEELETENTRIQAELIAEEQELTLLRKTLPAEEFSARAETFDRKVEEIRARQDAKARDLALVREADVQAFLAAVAPVLRQILARRGAGVLLDKQTVILSLDTVDVTDEAIRLVDAVLGESVETSP